MAVCSELNKFYFDKKRRLRDISDSRILDPRFSYDEQINEYRALSKKVQTTIDMLQYYPNWYYINGDFYYYKNKDIFIELFISELFKEYGVPALNFEIVTNNGDIGLISKNFKSPLNEYYRFDEFVEKFGNYSHQYDINRLTNLLRRNTTMSDSNKIMSIIQKVIPLDIMFGQSDRLDYNLYFEKHSNRLSICPMFDNGYSFKREFENNYVSSFQNLYFLVNDDVSNEDLENNKGVEYSLSIIGNNLALQYEFNRALHVDINRILERVLKKYNVYILKEQSQFIKEYYEGKKDMVEKTLSML